MWHAILFVFLSFYFEFFLRIFILRACTCTHAMVHMERSGVLLTLHLVSCLFTTAPARRVGPLASGFSCVCIPSRHRSSGTVGELLQMGCADSDLVFSLAWQAFYSASRLSVPFYTSLHFRCRLHSMNLGFVTTSPSDRLYLLIGGLTQCIFKATAGRFVFKLTLI